MAAPIDDDDDDALAAEWAAMSDAPQDDSLFGADTGDSGGGGSARVLNQDEIDSLLGFDDGRAGTGDGSGIAAIVNSALVS